MVGSSENTSYIKLLFERVTRDVGAGNLLG